MQSIKLGINMNLIHQYYSNDENFYNLNPLQSAVNFGIISPQSNKTIAEPANSTYLHTAQSTPKACFFMRNIRTPKNKLRILFQHLSTIYSSMVACSGKGSPFAANRMWQFCRPLHVTAKACKLSAVTLKCLHTELRKMYQFIFALIRAPQIKIRLLADNEQQARSRFTDGDTLLFVGRINQNPLKNNRTFSTNGKNHSLPKCEDAGSIAGTETKDGNRNRHLSGIFLPKIHSLHAPKKLGALSYIEFAVRATHGNKALSTNNVGYSLVAVEPLSHPIQGDNSLLTKPKRNPTMKIYPKNNRTLAALPTLSVSATQGAQMFNQSISFALQEMAEFNDINNYKQIPVPMSKKKLTDLRSETENLCESIEYGLMHLGDLMQTLGNLADTEQDFTREAMSNDNVKHIGGLIKANAYLLNALRETASLSEYYLAGGLDGEIERNDD